MNLSAIKLVWQAFVRSWHDEVSRHSAAVAYYAVFAAAPLLLVGTTVLSWAVGPIEAHRDFGQGLRQLFGEVPERAVEDVLRRATDRPAAGAWIIALEVAVIAYAVVRLFAVIQQAMNTIWRVRPGRGPTLLETVRDRWLSFGMVALAGPMILAGLTLSSLLAAGTRRLTHEWWVHRILGAGSSLLVLTVVIACLFRLLPDVRIGWRQVWAGATVSATLLTAGQALTGRYLAGILGYSFNGVVGSLAVVLVWVYFCAIILFFGAEFTVVYCRERGCLIRPAGNFVTISEQELVRSGETRTDFLAKIAEKQAKRR